MADVLKNVAALGTPLSRAMASLYTDPQALKAQLDANGLTMPTAPASLEHDLEDTAKDPEAGRDARYQGRRLCTLASRLPEQRPTSAEGWKTLLATGCRKIGKPFQDAGLTFGYHNHDFEFVDL